MPLGSYKPTSAGLRGMTRSTFEEVTTKEPYKPLLEPQKRGSGATTRASSPFATAAAARSSTTASSTSSAIRSAWPAKLATIEYDPNRSARIGLPITRTARSATCSCRTALRRGRGRRRTRGRGACRQRAAALQHPARHHDHNIELVPGKGGQIVRSAGVSAQLLAKEGDFAAVRLPSGEVRRVSLRCMATVGQVSNLDHENQNLGKAGRARHMGLRPKFAASS